MKRLSLILALSAFTLVAAAQTSTPKKDSSQSKLSYSSKAVTITPDTIDLKDVANNIGHYVEVKGTVYGHKAFDRFILLDIGAAYPNQVLTVLINGNAFATFKTSGVDTKVVLVKGVIKNYKGKPEIVVSAPQYIKVID